MLRIDKVMLLYMPFRIAGAAAMVASLCSPSRGLAADSSLPEHVRTALARQELLRSSENSDFALHYYGRGEIENDKSHAGKTRQIRATCDWNGMSAFATLRGGQGLPRQIYPEKRLLNLDVGRTGWQSYTGFKWYFFFNDQHFNRAIVRTESADSIQPAIAADALSFAEMVGAIADLNRKWHPASHTYSATNPNGVGLFIRLRNSVDEKQFGPAWSMVRGVTSSGSEIGLGGPCTTSIPYARQSHFSPEELIRLLPAEELADDASNSRFSLGQTLAVPPKPAIRAWEILWYSNNPYATESKKIITEATLAMKLAADALESDRDDLAGNSTVANSLAEAICQWEDGLVGSFKNEIAPPADPYMRWLRTEYSLRPDRAWLLQVMARRFLQTRERGASSRVRLIQAIAQLGSPYADYGPGKAKHIANLLEEAVRRTQLMLPCEEEHREACYQMLNDVESLEALKDAALHSLLLLGEWKKLDVEQVDAWSTRHLEKAGKARRTITLSRLLAAPGGDAFLMNQIERGVLSKDTAEHARSLIELSKPEPRER